MSYPYEFPGNDDADVADPGPNPLPNPPAAPVPAAALQPAVTSAPAHRAAQAVPAPNVPPPLRFGLCGAAGGGKTTYLAALSLAVQSAEDLGNWSMVAADEVSRDFLVERQEELITGRSFPQPTLQVDQLSWQVWGEPAQSHRHRRIPRWRGRSEQVSFTLDVEDVPGEIFLLGRRGGIPMTPESLDRLVESDALIFLFDPIRELTRDDDDKNESNWAYFHNLLETVKMRLAQQGRLHRGRLPQHVGMCVTKFDEPSIFTRAFERHLIDVDAGGQPQVPPERAEDFFGWICSWIDEARSDGSSAQLRAQVQASFMPGRVHYFATSAIGFWTAPHGRFDPNDFQNLDIVDGAARLRGPVRPVNVLEPLVELERHIRREGKR